MIGFAAIPAAGVLFFSAWLTMIFWVIVAPELARPTISYSMAMLITIRGLAGGGAADSGRCQARGRETRLLVTSKRACHLPLRGQVEMR
jgi:hypothetical protein